MSIYIGSGNQAQAISKLYTGVDGVARPVRKVYAEVGGTAKLVYAVGSPISSYSVGSIVKIKVSGADRDFIIAHQGLPSSDYDASCNGTWLLQRYVYDDVKYNADFYENSNLHAYMNNTFFPQLDARMQNLVKHVKIPFRDNKGAKGLDTQAFELAACEIGFSISENDSGAKLTYFKDGNSVVAYNTSGESKWWWTRSRYTNFLWGNEMYCVTSNGALNESSGTCKARPCIIVPFDTLVDDDGYIVT